MAAACAGREKKSGRTGVFDIVITFAYPGEAKRFARTRMNHPGVQDIVMPEVHKSATSGLSEASGRVDAIDPERETNIAQSSN